MVTEASELIAELSGVSNDGAEDIGFTEPYTVRLTIEGTAAILFHRWSNAAVAEKAASAKNSKAKKSDNLESYVYRLDPDDKASNLALPGEYIRRSIIDAAKFRQDPRSPRKSAMDLYKAGLVATTELADLGTPKWDYEDQRRVVVQRSGITRSRPAMKPGWRATWDLAVLVPEYISRHDLLATIQQAGRLIGLADFRPTFGRYQVVNFEVLKLE